MKIQINSKFEVEVDNITKIEKSSNGKARVYLKQGYPKIIKSDKNFDYIKLILINFQKYL
jgi:hypothetical protein